jgi:hypothetical protein
VTRPGGALLRSWILLATTVSVGCGRLDYRALSFDATIAPQTDAALLDADTALDATGADAARLDGASGDGGDVPTTCLEHSVWGDLHAVAGLGSGDDDSPSLSADGLTMLFGSVRSGARQIHFARRPSRTAPFETPAIVAELTATGEENLSPTISGDALTLSFLRYAPFQCPWLATRASPTDPWSSFVRQDALCGDTAFIGPELTDDGLAIYYNDFSARIYVARRSAITEAFAPGALVPELSGGWPTLSSDELEIWFTGVDEDIWTSRRSDVGSPFEPPVPVSELSTASSEGDPAISSDGLELFFGTDRSGGSNEIWVATRTCTR